MSKELARLDQLTNTFGIIQSDKDDIRALEYYRDELEVQVNKFEAFKDKVNSIIEKGKQQEYLNEFRKMLSGSCITHNRTVTIIQCTNIITRGQCNFHQQCETRKTILEMIKI